MLYIPVTRRPGGRRAIAATEFALALPVLLLLMIGAVDFGRFAYSHVTLTNAVRAGTGYGSVNPYTTATLATWKANVKQAVVDEMSTMSGFNSSLLTVTVTNDTTGEPSGGWRVQVVASYPFTTLITWPGIPSTTTMQRSVAMRGIR
jgi:Flp pilus assembly protein TadG